ncbi:hypothetical protein M413DRAFT_445140 [Hebeloma cylindrosporum]|uniref:Uncharacterized protein n=1 Tax=Hebeloma cylindrosporum TaxID=76867 RepID=A0A0C3CCF8_HEBCY|nr:hypothetical protein M413DRAFT_445140 [Hebeloma cylindrosporum h7]
MDVQREDASNPSACAPKLSLPSPEAGSCVSDAHAKKLDVDGPLQSIKLDELGPMVVNNDGTLSRIANWAQMTDAERERTVRVLSKRNRLRLANEEKKQRDLDGEAGVGPSSEQTGLSILKES